MTTNPKSSAPFPFSDDQLNALEKLLFSDDLDRESLDLFGIHGLLCAFAVGPLKPDPCSWPRLILDEHDSLVGEAITWFNQSLKTLFMHIQNQLNTEESFPLPEEIYEDETALRNWCMGFVEGFLLNEEAWFAHQDESAVAALMLPVMSHSGLFDDEYFKEFKTRQDIYVKMISDIPENLIDLFLLYHS